jgi:CBS domain-containing protein
LLLAFGQACASHEEEAMRIRELMIPHPRIAQPTDTLDHVAQMMRDEDVGAILVAENERLLGIITDRDITIHVVAAGRDPRQSIVRDFMTTWLVTAHPEMTDHEALDLMGREQIRRLPVVENGRLVGIIALGDFAMEAESDKKIKEEVEETLEEISEPAHR